MSNAYIQVWVRSPIADGEIYDVVSRDKEGLIFTSATPFSFDNSELDEDLFEPRLQMTLHDDVHLADIPEPFESGGLSTIELPQVPLRTDVGNHTLKTPWMTLTYNVSRDTTVNYPCFVTNIHSVFLPNWRITLTPGEVA